MLHARLNHSVIAVILVSHTCKEHVSSTCHHFRLALSLTSITHLDDGDRKHSNSQHILRDTYTLLYLTICMRMRFSLFISLVSIAVSACHAWVMPAAIGGTSSRATRHHASSTQLESSLGMAAGSKHGENSCFLPLEQLDQDYYAPRIVQVSNKSCWCLGW